MSTQSDGFCYTEEELKLTSFYSKYKTAMDRLQPSQSMEGRKPIGEAKETPHLNISPELDLKGASRVKRFLESKRCVKKKNISRFPLLHPWSPCSLTGAPPCCFVKREALTAGSEPVAKRRRPQVAKNSGGILVSRELNKESFPAEGIIRSQDWDSRASQKSLTLPLDNFGLDDEDQNQTLVMRVTVPKDSTTWAIKYANCSRRSRSHGWLFMFYLHYNTTIQKIIAFARGSMRTSWMCCFTSTLDRERKGGHWFKTTARLAPGKMPKSFPWYKLLYPIS